jgi:ppGpp synthetase/RelA/SpoT-type nucleotidyltranferase
LPSQGSLDRLGVRLSKIGATAEDLQALDDYRRTFAPAYQYAVTLLEQWVSEWNEREYPETVSRLAWAGRFPKSSSSLIGKLQRQTVRLSQIQDMAGVRVTTPSRFEQDLLVQWLGSKFPKAAKYDRLKSPSHGYRAVHFVVEVHDRVVEIQLRTRLQDAWAQLSEKLNDRYPGTKYGTAEANPRVELLQQASELIAQFEEFDDVTTSQLDWETVTATKDNIGELLQRIMTEADEAE